MGALFSVCVFWGATFLWMKQGANAMREVWPDASDITIGAFFLFVRFAIAVLLMPVILPRSIKSLDLGAWKWGFWVSLPFASGFLLQIFGLTQADIPPSQSAFLTSLYVVATPVFGALLLRKRPPIGVIIGVPLAVLGAGFIQGPPEGGLSVGAWATIVCAAIFGIHILITDVATKRTDPIAMTFTMLVFATLWMGGVLAFTPDGLGYFTSDRLAAMAGAPMFWITEILCALFATVIALSVLNRWQKELHPSRAALVYTGEPVFASIISVIAGHDTIHGWLIFGGSMILAANLAAELIRRPKRKPVPPEIQTLGDANPVA